MKNRIFMTLLLSVVALPVFAQQTNSNSSAQPAVSADQSASASPSVAAAGKEPLQPPSHQDFWDGDEPSFGALILHPFATKEYVRRHVEPIRDRINELEELTASDRKMTRDVDGRAQQGIQLVSAKADIADQHALEAANKAQMANTMATSAQTRVSAVETVVGNIDQYKSAPQTEILFRPGQTTLSKQAKDALDAIATQLKDQHGYIIEVQGFSSGQGQAAIANSRKVADSVARYLMLNHQIPVYRIYLIGMGNADVAKGMHGARVEVSLLKNDIEQTAKQ
jgi:outer membrane protein OmpA-like peptidoglycan-associated protein